MMALEPDDVNERAASSGGFKSLFALLLVAAVLATCSAVPVLFKRATFAETTADTTAAALAQANIDANTAQERYIALKVSVDNYEQIARESGQPSVSDALRELEAVRKQNRDLGAQLATMENDLAVAGIADVAAAARKLEALKQQLSASDEAARQAMAKVQSLEELRDAQGWSSASCPRATPKRPTLRGPRADTAAFWSTISVPS